MGPDLVLHLIPGHGEGSTGWVVREASRGQACTEPGPIPLPGAAAGCAPAEDSWLVFGWSRGDQVAHSSAPFSIALELGPSPAERTGMRGDSDWEMSGGRARQGVFSLLPAMSSEPLSSTPCP